MVRKPRKEARTPRPMDVGQRVTLAPVCASVPAYGGKPAVLRDTVLTVAEVSGDGTARNPWHVVATDGTHNWHFDPGSLELTADSRRSP
jgi:hypothetical protein